MDTETASSKTPKGTDLALSFVPELKNVPANVSREFIIMTSINAPEYKADSRAPIDLIGVIDRSGSMAGDRLDLVKETMRFVVENLQTADRLGIVTYDDSVQTHFPITQMDKAGKERALNSISSIYDGGSTNLCGGLVAGVDEMRKRTTKNEVSSVLLFTDGQANVGYTSAADIIRATVDAEFAKSSSGGFDFQTNFIPQQQMQMPMQQQAPQPSQGFFGNIRNAFRSAPQPQPVYQQQMQMPMPQPQQQAPIPQQAPVLTPLSTSCTPKPPTSGTQDPLPCTINAFGFGTDHNAELLKKIADHGSGAYYYIEKKDNISEAFADCLGGLLSTVGQNLVLQFDAVGEVVIKKLHSKFKITELKPGKSYQLSIGDIQSEEEKDILISLTLPAVGAALDVSDVLKVTLNYFNVISKKDLSTEINATIARPSSAEKETRNFALDKQLNRVIAAEAMETSNAFAKNGQMEEARKAIDAAAGRIKESVSAGDAFCKSLVEDLERCKSGLTSQNEYNMVGSKMLMNQAHAHMQQRSTNVGWAAQACYQTSNRQQMYSNFKSK